MHSRTQAALNQLEQTEWFRNVGRRDTDKAIVLTSWMEAIASCASGDWEDLTLEAANRFAEKVASRSPERFQQWNVVVEEVKAMTAPLVARKIEHVVRDNKLPPVIQSCVNWDILHLAIESEFADIVPPGFYAGQAYWYVAGHFPCGWEGPIPGGRPIIY